MKNKYELPLLYTSSVPIIMLAALIHNCFIGLLMVASILPATAGIIGVTAVVGTRVVALTGLLRLISPPSSLTDIVLSPLHTLFYVAFMASSTTLTSLRILFDQLDQIL